MSRRCRFAGVNFVLFMSAFALVVTGQDKELTVVESRGGANCEAVAAIVDSFVQGLKPEDSLAIISYKSDRESRKGIELQRLRTARKYLTEYFKNTPYRRSADKVVAAVADETTDKARLDFYVNGVISLRIAFFDRSSLALSPCVRPGS